MRADPPFKEGHGKTTNHRVNLVNLKYREVQLLRMRARLTDAPHTRPNEGKPLFQYILSVDDWPRYSMSRHVSSSRRKAGVSSLGMEMKGQSSVMTGLDDGVLGRFGTWNGYEEGQPACQAPPTGCDTIAVHLEFWV